MICFITSKEKLDVYKSGKSDNTLLNSLISLILKCCPLRDLSRKTVLLLVVMQSFTSSSGK